MELTDFFKAKCRETAIHLNADIRFKSLTHGMKNSIEGIIARFVFSSFYFDILFARRGMFAAVPDLLWLSAGFESKDDIPFSIYDFLAEFRPDDFNLYTFTDVSDEEAISTAFAEIEAVFTGLLPFMRNAAENGVIRNNIINAQKKRISEFCGNSLIFDTGVPSDDLTEKLKNMLLDNFVATEISNAVSIYSIPKSKAIKKLKSKKNKSHYEDNYLEHLLSDKSDDANKPKDKKAGIQKKKKLSKLCVVLLTSVIIQIPVSAVVLIIYYALNYFIFRDAVFSIGTDLYNGFPAVIVSYLFSFCIGIRISPDILSRMKKTKKRTRSRKEKNFLNIYTAFAETLTLFMCLCAANCTTAFYENTFSFSEKSISLQQTEYSYDHIQHYEIRYDSDDPYYVLITDNGSEISLFDSTLYNTETFEKTIVPFLEQKGITSSK